MLSLVENPSQSKLLFLCELAVLTLTLALNPDREEGREQNKEKCCSFKWRLAGCRRRTEGSVLISCPPGVYPPNLGGELLLYTSSWFPHIRSFRSNFASSSAHSARDWAFGKFVVVFHREQLSKFLLDSFQET